MFEVRESAPVDRNRERAVRMAQVVEQFATRLTLRPIRCRVADSGVAPAWSTSNTISFNGQNIGDLLDPRVVTATRGLALHEVCHILFTPRTGSDIMQWVLANKRGRAFNALEDQRIETLMVGRFGQSVVDWFTYMVAEHLLDSPESMAYAFPLIRGRKYLPVELRRAVRDLYVNQQDLQELSDIIDEYRLLVFPADTERAKPLIDRFDQLVKQAGNHDDGQGQGEGDGWSKTNDIHADRQTGEHESTTASKPLSNKEQERAKQNAQARNEQDEADVESATNNQPAQPENEDEFNFGDGNSDWEDESDETDSSSNGSDGDVDWDEYDEGADEDWSDVDGDSDGIGGQDSDSSSDSSTSSDSSQGSDSDSNSTEAGTAGDTKLTDLLEQTMDSILDRLADQVAEDIAKYNGDVQLEGERVGAPKPAQSRTESVSAMAMRASKSFGIELERLRADFDPAWERKTSSGRINAQRYMTGADLDEVFDRWDEGRDDAVDIEAVILLDVSGSMQNDATNAYESMWALKRALDKVGAGVTVVTFASDTRLLYSNTELASNTMKFAGTGGGTSPLEALKYSTKVFADSSRAVKVLFTITDGEWSNSDECDKLVKRMRDGGVLTALAYIAGAWDGESAKDKHHGSEVFSHIRNSADLFVLGRQLVKVATQRNLAH